MLSYKSPKDIPKIGFCTYQDAWTWERGEVASTRIRVYYVAKYMKNAMISNDFEELRECDAVIFQTRYEPKAVDFAKTLVADGKITVLDLTDPHWDLAGYSMGACETDLRYLKEMISVVDLVTLSTLNLQLNFFHHFKEKASLVIPDRIDLESHNRTKSHIDKEKYTILWHGSYGNICSLDELARGDLEKLGEELKLKLICIYDRTKDFKVAPFKNLELEVIEWSNQKVIDGLLNSDISINPKYQFGHWKAYKSNNKTIKSWALGIPCVEKDFYDETKRLLSSAKIRNKDGREKRETVVEKYDSKISAREIEDIVYGLIVQKQTYAKAIIKKSRKNIVVYTAICDDYDTLKDSQSSEGADFIAYLDKPQSSNIWEVRPYTRRFYDPTRDAKIFKALSHLYMRDYEYNIWIDASVTLKVPAFKLIKKYLIDTKSDIAVYRHNQRDCIYEEAKFDLLLKKDTRRTIEPQVARYRAEGHPEHWGLFACTIIFRRNCEAVTNFNNDWWSEICAGSERDQEAFAYLIRKHNMKIAIAEPSPGKHWNTNEFDNSLHTRKHRLYDGTREVGTTVKIREQRTSLLTKITWVLLDDVVGISLPSSERAKNMLNHNTDARISSSLESLEECGVIIYQNRFEPHDLDYVRSNRKNKKFILDLTEPYYNSRFFLLESSHIKLCNEMITSVNAVVVPTLELKNDLVRAFPDVDCEVVENGNEEKYTNLVRKI